MARTRRAGRRADLRWTFGSSSFAAQGAGSASNVIVSSGSTSQTLVRTRGNLLAYVDAAQVPGGLVQVAIGMLVVQAGSTATSLPLTDGEAPFFYYDAFAIGYEEMVIDVVDVPGITSYRKEIDVKAMRVIRPDQDIVLIVEQASILSAQSINVNVTARFLFSD